MLETKLYVPRRRRGLVPRERLCDRLDRGAEAALTLVCAPPGFGKTTLVSQWLEAWAAAVDSRRVAWVSLDQGDNHPATFWSYLVAALQQVVPAVQAAGLRDTPQPPPIEVVLTGVLNELTQAGGDVVLVLDDYHVIGTAEIHTGMAFLLDHLPAPVHLVIASRSDPPFPLARLRARGELTEARAADLRFTTGESAAYLNGEMGLALSAQDVAALDERTEGWVAALQLAALSMQGRTDIPGFIAGFAGDDRYIVDFLAEEVLHRQPPRIQDFLLRTSILSRLTGPLCDAVAAEDGPGDGRAMLEELERANLFLIPLDDRRRWYRYHHLFEDVLQARLLDERPDEVPELHRRASHWFEQNGEPVEAIEHALLAQDVDRAADLVELTARSMHKDRRESVVRAWLDALPPDLFDTRPVLCISYAAALMASGDIGRVESYLLKAERWFGPDAPTAGMVVANQEEFDRGPASLALYRAGQALLMGDRPGTVRHAQLVLNLVPEDDHAPRGAANGLLGLAAWSAGDLEGGHRAYARCVAHLLEAGQVADTLGVSIAMGDIRITQGRLGDAQRTYEQALATAAAAATARPTLLRGTADMHVGMTEIHRERGEVDAARAELRASHELGEFNGLPQNAYRARVAEAGIQEADGDLDGALGLLDEAERLYVGDFSPQVRPVAAVRARLLARHGRLAEALRWVSESGLAPDDDLSYLTEFSHITLARVLLASASPSDRGPVQESLVLLRRLQTAAEAGARAGNVLEILILQALAHQALGDAPAALGPLAGALELAEPEGYVRLFADDGEPMRDLLTAAARRRLRPGYVRRLLAAIEVGPGPEPARTGGPQDLIDPLSERELHVLRLLGTDLTGPQIARELTVSLNTAHPHQEHLRQARCRHPAVSGQPCQRAGPAAAEPLTHRPGPHDHHIW